MSGHLNASGKMTASGMMPSCLIFVISRNLSGRPPARADLRTSLLYEYFRLCSRSLNPPRQLADQHLAVLSQSRLTDHRHNRWLHCWQPGNQAPRRKIIKGPSPGGASRRAKAALSPAHSRLCSWLAAPCARGGPSAGAQVGSQWVPSAHCWLPVDLPTRKL